MNNDVKKLKELISNNPPIDKKGELEVWNEKDWEIHFDELSPNWREVIKKNKVWKEIKGVRPKGSYGNLLKLILQYAPDEFLIEYLNSSNDTEANSSFTVLIKDYGKRLTCTLWEKMDGDTKSWLISKIIDEVRDEYNIRLFGDFEIFFRNTERYFKRMWEESYWSWFYPYAFLLFIEGISLYSMIVTFHPLWLKLKTTVELANDLLSIRKLNEIEERWSMLFQRIIEKLRHILQPEMFKKLAFISKNVMLDPSLLLNPESAENTFNFIEEYNSEFKFYISASFYDFLGEYTILNNTYNVIEFFYDDSEQVSKNHISYLMNKLKKNKEYINFFVISEEFYKNKYKSFYDNLFNENYNGKLAKILFEEWVFLLEYSWVVAKTKKTFEKFKDAGAVTVELSKKVTEQLIRKTLKKKDDEFVSVLDRLRAIGKWIAVGGTSATTFFDATIGFLIGFSTGVFLLMDPDDETKIN